MPDCATCVHYTCNDPLACPDKCYTCGMLQKNYEPKNYITTSRANGKTLLQEEMIARMGKEDGFKSVFKTYQEANEALSKKYGKRKEYDKMTNYKNIVVYIDGKCYKPTNGDFAIRVGEYPHYDLRVELDPAYMVKERFHNRCPEIKDVIFNPPATIIMWSDGTKTVVKTQNGEAYDPEKGLAMAYLKKALGNKGNYFNQVKKWTQPYWDREEEIHNWAMSVIYGAAAKVFRDNEEAMAKKEEADT